MLYAGDGLSGKGCALGRVRVLFLLSMAVSDGFSHCNHPFLHLRNRLMWTECLTESAFQVGPDRP
jgi:hypothetical protein